MITVKKNIGRIRSLTQIQKIRKSFNTTLWTVSIYTDKTRIRVRNGRIQVNNEGILVNNEGILVNNEEMLVNNEEMLVNNEEMLVNSEESQYIQL